LQRSTLLVIAFTKEVMFYGAFICLLATLCKTTVSDLCQTRDASLEKEDAIKFSGSHLCLDLYLQTF